MLRLRTSRMSSRLVYSTWPVCLSFSIVCLFHFSFAFSFLLSFYLFLSFTGWFLYFMGSEPDPQTLCHVGCFPHLNQKRVEFQGLSLLSFSLLPLTPSHRSLPLQPMYQTAISVLNPVQTLLSCQFTACGSESDDHGDARVECSHSSCTSPCNDPGCPPIFSALAGLIVGKIELTFTDVNIYIPGGAMLDLWTNVLSLTSECSTGTCV